MSQDNLKRSEPSKRITLKQIARESGFSLMTVSYALRKSPKIKASTQAQIQAVADRLGYQPDPALSALVAYRTAQSTQHFKGILAILTFGEKENTWMGDRYTREVIKGARSRAGDLGYELQPFWASDPSHQHGSLDRILQNRGIQGLLITLQLQHRTAIPLDFSHYCAVGLSRSLDWTGLDYVTNNHYTACARAWDACVQRGYHQIGYVGNRDFEGRMNLRIVSAYLGRQAGTGKKGAPPPFYIPDDKPDDFIGWYERHKPEVILSQQASWIRNILETRGIRVPQDLGLVNPVLLDENLAISGIEQPTLEIGMEAVDMLHSKLLLSQWGLPRRQKSVTMDGEWHEGETLPDRGGAHATAPSLRAKRGNPEG